MESRFYLGVVILVVLLVLAIGTSLAMQAIHTPVEAALAEAANLALAGNTDHARTLAQEAYARWQRYHSMTASFADHSPMDDTDTLFQELLVYGKTGEWPHFIACCRQLQVMTQAMYDAHGFSFKNFL